jgi:MFS family permease
MSDSPPPPTLRSLVTSVYLPTVLFAIGQGAVIPVIAITATDLGASVALAGVIVAVRGIGTMVFDVPAGALVGRLGERRAMVVGTAILAASLLGCIASPNPFVFAVCLFVMGCGWALFLLGRLSYVSDVMPPDMRGRALSTLGGVQRIGNFVGPFVGAAAIWAIGLDGAYLTHVVLAVAACIVLIAVPDPHETTATEHAHAPVASVLRDNRRAFLTIGAGAAILGVLRVCRQALVPLWGLQIGLDAAQISLLFGISSAIDMTFFYPVGVASDRFGRRAVALPCLTLLSIGFLAMPLTSSFAGLALVGALMGVGNGLGSGIVMTLGADLAPPNGRAAFLGAWRLVSDVGQAGGPLIAAAATAVATLGVASASIGLLGFVGVATFAVFLPSRPEAMTASSR